MSELQVRNPRTGAVDFSFAAANEQGVAAVCEALRAAQPAWHALGPERRIAILTDFIAAVPRTRRSTRHCRRTPAVWRSPEWKPVPSPLCWHGRRRTLARSLRPAGNGRRPSPILALAVSWFLGCCRRHFAVELPPAAVHDRFTAGTIGRLRGGPEAQRGNSSLRRAAHEHCRRISRLGGGVQERAGSR